MVGSRLGPYRLVSLLGTGGMGEVYRAVDERLHREVAIKVLPVGAGHDEDGRDRLRREAITLSQLNHPRVAAVHDVGCEQDRDYIVLEYVAGGTLADLLLQGPRPLADVLRVGTEIAEGLEAAHEHGIVHRDLKPANIAFDPKGQVKILDFGIAGFLAGRAPVPTGLASTLGLGAIGTLPYMAPEQLRAGATDDRTDLYALGVVLFEMATGQQPFPAENTAVAIESILHDPPPPLRSLRPQLPEALAAIVERLLAKKPEDRYASATELLVDLRALAEDPRARPAHVRRSRRRRTLGLAIGGLSALLLLALGERSLHRLAEAPPAHRVSVVVFPLEILAGEEGSKYLGQAFAEAVTVNLAQIPGLEVIPVPASAPSTREGAADLVRSARQLGAGHAVSGSLLRQESALRATLQLVDADRNRLVWGTQYTIDPADVGRSANELARELASRLGLHEARMYEYFRYEGGTAEMAKWPGLPATIEALRRHDVERGLALTESLVVLYPRVPEAHVLRLVALVDQDNARQGSLGARAAVLACLEALERIDPGNPTVPITRAAYVGNAAYDTGREADADRVLTRVLERSDLRPGLRSQALRYRAAARGRQGRLKEATTDMEEAIRQDPANPYNYVFLATLLGQEDRHELALQKFRQAVAIDPGFYGINFIQFMERAGYDEQALEASQELCRTKPSAACWAYRAIQLAGHGKGTEARRALARARAFRRNGATEYMLAQAHGLLGDVPEALAALRSAIALGLRSTDVDSDSAFVVLRGEPAFRRLVEQARPDSTDIPRI